MSTLEISQPTDAIEHETKRRITSAIDPNRLSNAWTKKEIRDELFTEVRGLFDETLSDARLYAALCDCCQEAARS